MGYKARITAISNKSWEKSERLSGNTDSKKNENAMSPGIIFGS